MADKETWSIEREMYAPEAPGRQTFWEATAAGYSSAANAKAAASRQAHNSRHPSRWRVVSSGNPTEILIGAYSAVKNRMSWAPHPGNVSERWRSS